MCSRSRASATRRRSSDTEQYQSTEWHYGAFQRSISLPRSVKREAIEATYENGIVEVRVPKAAEVTPQRIELKAKGEGSAIDTGQAT